MNNKLKKTLKTSPFYSSLRSLRFDITKLRSRLRTKRMYKKYLKKNLTFPRKLHFGSGSKLIKGWLNIDLINSDIDMDFSKGLLPFEDNSFDIIVSQHVIEHLEMEKELLPIIKELRRVLSPGGVFWISCPSILKICQSYLNDNCQSLLKGRLKRDPGYTTRGYPNSIIVNDLFYQIDEHKNLFDFKLLEKLMINSGFSNIEEINEKIFLDNIDFPKRHDDEQSLYVKAY